MKNKYYKVEDIDVDEWWICPEFELKNGITRIDPKDFYKEQSK